MKAADEDGEAVVALQAGRRVSKKEVTLSVVPAQPAWRRRQAAQGRGQCRSLPAARFGLLLLVI